jgi:hypothetical protein
MPSPELWEGLNDPESRLTAALGALYGWFARNETLTAAVLRDAEHHEPVQRIAALRFVPGLQAIAASLSGGLSEKGRAALHLALSFHTWRTLTREAGLKPAAAVELMVESILKG